MLVHAFKWSFLANIAPILIAPLMLVVLARYLLPDDFAIVAMVTVVLAFVKVFRDGGLGHIIIQAKTIEIVNIVFTLQLILSVFFVFIVWFIAPYIGAYFDSSEVVMPLRVASLELLVAPLLDIPVFLKMREIDFKAQFFRKALVPLMAGIISILMAIKGYGYWAVIAGNVVGVYITAFILVLILRWRPKLDFGFVKIREYLGFGSDMLLQGMVAWVINAVDKVFLSHSDTKQNVGYYELASRASHLPFSLISQPVNQVVYPLLRGKVNQGDAVNHYYLKTTALVAHITLPLSCFLLFFHEGAILLLLGEQWLPIKDIFQSMVVVVMMGTLVSINVEMYKIIDRTRIMSKFMVVRALISIPVYWMAAGYGVLYLAMSRAGLALIFSPMNTLLLLKSSKIRVAEYLRALLPPVTVSVLLATMFAILSSLQPDVYSFVVSATMLCITYIYLGFTIFYPLMRRR